MSTIKSVGDIKNALSKAEEIKNQLVTELDKNADIKTLMKPYHEFNKILTAVKNFMIPPVDNLSDARVTIKQNEETRPLIKNLLTLQSFFTQKPAGYNQFLQDTKYSQLSSTNTDNAGATDSRHFTVKKNTEVTPEEKKTINEFVKFDAYKAFIKEYTLYNNEVDKIIGKLRPNDQKLSEEIGKEIFLSKEQATKFTSGLETITNTKNSEAENFLKTYGIDNPSDKLIEATKQSIFFAHLPKYVTAELPDNAFIKGKSGFIEGAHTLDKIGVINEFLEKSKSGVTPDSKVLRALFEKINVSLDEGHLQKIITAAKDITIESKSEDTSNICKDFKARLREGRASTSDTTNTNTSTSDTTNASTSDTTDDFPTMRR